jgi:hypothetical protein
VVTLLLLLALTLPNLTVTPGVARPLTLKQVCSTKWGKDRRHVTDAMKTQVAKNYGLTRTDITASGKSPCCEIDHLVPRELGGADDVKNLWPQNWKEAHVKDQRENALHVLVCAPHPTITLEAAQDEMRHWGR